MLLSDYLFVAKIKKYFSHDNFYKNFAVRNAVNGYYANKILIFIRVVFLNNA